MTSSESAFPEDGNHFWAAETTELLDLLGTSEAGLTSTEAGIRLERFGTLAKHRGHGTLTLLLRQFTNPIILILVVATLISISLGDTIDATIILMIIIASGLLGFYQERGALRAVEALMATVQVHCEVRRDGHVRSIPFEEVVPGDIVLLNAGDVIPGDCRVLETNDLLIDQSSLTGESLPAEKTAETLSPDTAIGDRTNSLFMGTHVASGSGIAAVVTTGARTQFGKISQRLAKHLPTGFERGITRFGYMLVRATVVLVAGIFIVNIILDRPVLDSLLFSLALAVGLTPQMLPAIVTISLARGAHRMSRERVIVKRLDAIEDFGSMTVLCTDKTGTLTQGVVKLDAALGMDGSPSRSVRTYAYLNAFHQRGLTNAIDDAILAQVPSGLVIADRLDEIPYSFVRKRLSVLVAESSGSVLVTKGAVDDVLNVCSWARTSDDDVALSEVLPEIRDRYRALSERGFRTLGVATRSLGAQRHVDLADEQRMTFIGFLTLLDPLKEGISESLGKVTDMGLSLRIVTGDNRFIAAHIGAGAGLHGGILAGDEIDGLNDEELSVRIRDVEIFAEVEPGQKERIVRMLRDSGGVVGYLGDGINDAPALNAADVGISVDTAVDVAKESSAIVLLEKNLDVLTMGVRIGRQTFANTMKYIRVTISANFGNMLSMAVAAGILPFLPLLPRQILLLNFLSDIPAMAISTDVVDPEQLDHPHAWDVRSIRNFMIVFGLISSIFDFLTFGVMRLAFAAGPGLFRSGWLVASVGTELAVMLVLRTKRPFYKSRPGLGLLIASIAVGVITIGLLFSPAAHPLGLQPLSVGILAALFAITAGYILVTEISKRLLSRSRHAAVMD